MENRSFKNTSVWYGGRINRTNPERYILLRWRIKCTLPITTLKVKCFYFMRVEYRCSMQYHCGQTYYDSTMNNTILLGQSVINDSEKLGFPEISSYKNESFNNI